jgi:hypothetical protein
MFKPISLGDRVKDPITGYTGIVTCITTWLHGCIRIGVLPEKLTNEGKLGDELYFDQSRLELVKAGVHKPLVTVVQEAQPTATHRSTGGPSREGTGFHR